MTNTTLHYNSVQEVWLGDFFLEYADYTGYTPYMGESGEAIFPIFREAQKKTGDRINIPMVRNLKGAQRTGTQTLEGFEEALGNDSDQIVLTFRRHAVAVDQTQTFPTDLDLFNAGRTKLKQHAGTNWQHDITDSLAAVIIPGVPGAGSVDVQVKFADANAAQRNAHLVANADRIKFVGTAGAGTVMATQLATVGTADKLSADVLSAAKRAALKCGSGSSPLTITPFKNDKTKGRSWFVLFVNPEGFRDLNADPKILAANTDARVRDVDSNPIFQGGDLIWDGIVIRMIQDMGDLGAVGDSGATVAVASLCGINAVGTAFGQDVTMIKDERDYGFVKGVGYQEWRGTKKISYSGVQNGVYSIFHASTADA